MKSNVSVVRFKFRFNILISGKIIKEMPGSVASGTLCIIWHYHLTVDRIFKWTIKNISNCDLGYVLAISVYFSKP
jgi:hypothetical protein